MSGLANSRLKEERRNFRKSRPFGFVAKPATLPDGSQDLMRWKCVVPGKEGTLFEGGVFAMTMVFDSDYPQSPPKCSFDLIDGKPLCHPNVYPSGKICLSIINPQGSDGGTWTPSTQIKVILLAIQTLLDEKEVNPLSPAQTDAYQLFTKDREAWRKRVREQVARVTPGGATGSASGGSGGPGGPIVLE
mmetsp:Transcript_33643/g.105623  ORF Transcript_33643/g.105623 Transcript_33643/m.105623 type:complete len:189 (+) Transcript_33643:88-654(+)|eukprot:CAMPEP_0185346400 /NCGR_PEP_ID=MMETSP1364-20130426/463_1 /TAXON_ID=38817 /ORGANISM="Gephyrocapsa oceanica, Strain RCC1303" /LENGTH=188 /DNA_ID=CAMNT_0027945679 /DNA_START=84 /DNA_END=650 /DNA_ORIENTATION=+